MNHFRGILLLVVILLVKPVVSAAQSDYELTSLKYKVTEQNDVWWRFSWILSVKNTSHERLNLRIHIHWQDSEGFELGTDVADCAVEVSSEVQECSGSDLVPVDVASKVAKAHATTGT